MESVIVTQHDLDDDFYWHATKAGVVAWDIETAGLDWMSDPIGTVQVSTGNETNIVVLRDHQPNKRLVDLLESPRVRKVFHHAPFDLRFMSKQWQASAQNVACTKIASKVLDPGLESTEHSLMHVLARHLGVRISKREQVSDWLAEHLTSNQLTYAVNDVLYLLELERVLVEACHAAGVVALLRESWNYLPTRVALDLRGSGDVFAY